MSAIAPEPDNLQRPRPEHAPAQPSNREPGAGVAARLRAVLLGGGNTQPLPHWIPVGLLTTVPAPWPPLVTTSVKTGRGGLDALCDDGDDCPGGMAAKIGSGLVDVGPLVVEVFGVDDVVVVEVDAVGVDAGVVTGEGAGVGAEDATGAGAGVGAGAGGGKATGAGAGAGAGAVTGEGVGAGAGVTGVATTTWLNVAVTAPEMLPSTVHGPG